MSLPIVLVGAGGHAKVALDILLDNGEVVGGFVDPQVDIFYDLKRRSDVSVDFSREALAMSLGGVKPDTLSNRLDLFNEYKSKAANFINIVSNSAHVSKKAVIGEGVFISNGVIINGPSKIGNLVIINTGAIIEHDVVVEEGAHIAPGAIILGDCHIGRNSMIGSGAVVLPGSSVPDNFLVPSLTRYPKKS